MISKTGHLEECHPFCTANPVDAWPGVGSRDHLHYYRGRSITRRFVGWQERAGYDIEITDPRGVVAEVEWRLSGYRAGSALTIAITPHLLGGLPRALRWVPDRILVRPRLLAICGPCCRGASHDRPAGASQPVRGPPVVLAGGDRTGGTGRGLKGRVRSGLPERFDRRRSDTTRHPKVSTKSSKQAAQIHS